MLALLLTASQIFSLRRLVRLPTEKQGSLGEIVRKLLPQNAVEALAFVALASTVALCDEFLYRGFALAVITKAASNFILLGVFASAVLFALAHLYQGRRGFVITFVVGLAFAAVRVWTQSLAPTIGAHWVADLVAGLAARRVLTTHAPLPRGRPSQSAREAEKNL